MAPAKRKNGRKQTTSSAKRLATRKTADHGPERCNLRPVTRNMSKQNTVAAVENEINRQEEDVGPKTTVKRKTRTNYAFERRVYNQIEAPGDENIGDNQVLENINNEANIIPADFVEQMDVAGDLEQPEAADNQVHAEDLIVDVGQPKKRQKQPSHADSLHGIHMAYHDKGESKRCRLQGCKRMTTNKCANSKCQMSLCYDPTEKKPT
jgi:hypothetical protein